MAGGRGLPEAMEDLSALPPDAPEQATATPVLLRLNTELTGKRRPTREEREFIVSTQNIVQELLEKGRSEGRLEGRHEGRLEGRREGRLTEARAALRSVLTRRGLAPSAEDEAKIDACTRTATLRRWLDQAIDATSVADALK